MIEPRIVKLEPMRLASCRVVSKSPEKEAFEMITAWAKKNELLGAKGTRFFGFDNPGPSGGGGKYGYEVWMAAESLPHESEGVSFNEFSGGTYAVVQTSLDRIGNAWKELIDWRAASTYSAGTHQCLEEHLSLPTENEPADVLIDLYLPISG